MPTARHALGGGVVNGTLYAVGGASQVTGCGTLSVVEAYDPATNMWTTKAPMTTTQSHLAVGVVDGILYAVGGITGRDASCSGGSVAGTLQAYNPATDTWTTKSPMLTARVEPTVGVINGILYAAGGEDASYTNVNTVEAYNPATDTWTTKSPMPTARYFAGGGVVNGILYVVGGYNDSGLLTTDVAYDPVSDTWTTIAPKPTRRYGLSGTVVNNVLYALGGANATGVLATNEAFTPPYAAQIQQPINADGSSVFSVKRGVVPVKFTLTQGGNATCALPPATIALTRTAGATMGAIDESVYTGSADTGSNFRIDSCQYVYNLSASALGVGTYQVDIKINGEVVGSAIFKLK